MLFGGYEVVGTVVKVEWVECKIGCDLAKENGSGGEVDIWVVVIFALCDGGKWVEVYA